MRWDTFEKIWSASMISVIIISMMVSYLVLSSLKCRDVQTELKEGLWRLSLELKTLTLRHTEMRTRFAKRQYAEILEKPFLGTEHLRRTIYSNIMELGNYISDQLKSDEIRDVEKDVMRIPKMLDTTQHIMSVLLSDLEKFQNTDTWNIWREIEAARVSELVQKKLLHLSNPEDCAEAKLLYCNCDFDLNCGYGCQLHKMVYCVIFAFATNRTFIFTAVPETLRKTFSLLSDKRNSCYFPQDEMFAGWEGDNSPKAIHLFYKPLEKLMPWSLPEELAHRVKRFNGDPVSWWVGQMLRFLMKLQPEVDDVIFKSINQVNFRNPIVGIHIRRTDKVGSEASFHHIDEYMMHVEEFYHRLQITAPDISKRVYVATDDVHVLEEARKKFPSFEFLGNSSISESAAVRNRSSFSSLVGLLVDLHMLSKCHYIVATFSSQIGRAAYEMMQAIKVDASTSFYSLDDIYFFTGQHQYYRVAVIEHKSNHSDEMSLKKGDYIAVAGNHWDGYGVGTNNVTKKRGRFPWYKTSGVFVVKPFPEHKQHDSDLN